MPWVCLLRILGLPMSDSVWNCGRSLVLWVPGISGSIGNGILGEYFPERAYNLLNSKRTRKRPKFQPCPWPCRHYEHGTGSSAARGPAHSPAKAPVYWPLAGGGAGLNSEVSSQSAAVGPNVAGKPGWPLCGHGPARWGIGDICVLRLSVGWNEQKFRYDFISTVCSNFVKLFLYTG